MTRQQPVLFVSWNSPLDAVDATNPLRDRLREFGAGLREVDAAIVLSTHAPRREADRGAFIVNGNARPPLIYDFADYPTELYSIGYPGFGHPELASRLAGRLISAGMKVRLDAERGWDHRI